MIRTIVCDVLAHEGWTRIEDESVIAIAQKSFHTAIGDKEALACLSINLAEGVAKLEGLYRSEGRNILAGCTTLIALDTSSQDISTIAQQFAADVDIRVRESYAARLVIMQKG